MEDAFFAWSGGKDSALALYRVLKQGKYQVKYLLTTVNEAHQRVSMHGVRLALLEQQALALGIPLKIMYVPENPDMADYEARMMETLSAFKKSGITTGIFGDIFLQDLRDYRENNLRLLGLKAHFPLWRENTNGLLQEFVQLGFKAKLVCVSDQRLGLSFVGRNLDMGLLVSFPEGVNPAGENGEYHSFVYDGPLFSAPIPYQEGEIILRDYAVTNKNTTDCATNNPVTYDTRFWFLDLIPVSN